MRFLEDLSRDLRYAVRMLRMAPLVSIAVAVTLAVGIGLDTGAFSIINGLMLRSRAEENPATFARLLAEYTERNRPVNSYGGQFSLSAYRTLQRESKVLDQLAAWRTDGILVEEDASRTLNLEVSCNFFSVYGLAAAKVGRLFRTDECEGSGANVVILSQELWQRRFASDPQILGKTILLNRIPFAVIGITPLDFSGRVRGPGIFVPLATQSRLTTSRDLFLHDDVPSLWLEGRLRPGATRAQLSSELNVLAQRVVLPWRELKMNILVTSGALIEDPTVRADAVWIMLMVITGLTLLLLVSCANVAVLLLARAAARRREIAVRIAVGASRLRVVRQLIAETLLLAVGAAGLGLWLAFQIPPTFQKMIPSMPHYPFTLDWHITGYLLAITLFASFAAGLAPAAECLRQDVWNTLKAGALSWRTGTGRWSVRDLLVVTQVLCSVVLMAVSAMFIRAEFTILNADPGFETRQVMQVPVQLATDRYNAAQAKSYYNQLQQRLAAIPSVEAVATTSESPLGTDPEVAARTKFHLPSQGETEGRAVAVRSVSTNYFGVVGIPIVLGPAFTPGMVDPNAVIVSQAFAAAFWPGGNPLGKTVVGSDGQELRVLAVARDTRAEHFGDADGPALYRVRTEPARGDYLMLRFRGDPQPLYRAVQAAVRDVDPQTFAIATTLRDALDAMADQFWILGKMLLTVTLVAAGLALLGIYGVVGYSVATRTRELGVRAALGATRGNLMRLVFSSGLRPVLAGTAIGLMLAALFAISISGALRGAPVAINNADPLPYLAVCVLLIGSAAAAIFGHARRAAAVQPMVALREE